jgi:hypothetical protein
MELPTQQDCSASYSSKDPNTSKENFIQEIRDTSALLENKAMRVGEKAASKKSVRRRLIVYSDVHQMIDHKEQDSRSTPRQQCTTQTILCRPIWQDY